MQLLPSLIPLGLALGSLVAASPTASHDKRSFVERDGTNFTVFEHAATGARLEFVKNSGICETTPGVNQYSGYLSVGTNMNSFSYGTETVTSTMTAAPFVWKLIQAFYAQFPQYENRDFGIFTESYGGHYGPEFAEYIEQQNAAIASGSITGQDIKLVALGVNNGWFDSTLQQKAYIDYSYSNSYRPLITPLQYAFYLMTYQTQCRPALQSCAFYGSSVACSSAAETCSNSIRGPLSQSADFSVYDIRSPSNDPNPPKTYVTYLHSGAVEKAIGAKSSYQECAATSYQQFSSTGDHPRSFLPQLSDVVQKGVQTVVWAGDADWICNWFGNQEAAEAVFYDGQDAFKSAVLMPYNVEGKQMGTFKAVGKLSFARVFGAGHEVPFYQPAVSLQVFKQTMMRQPLSST
ncbi:MAG: hypothetical protein Q9216_003245 [Gyalolechia sp. 2 TL-2023]